MWVNQDLTSATWRVNGALIIQCIPQLFKVDTVTISTTTSRSHNRSYVSTFKLTRSPLVQGHAKVDTVKLWCQSAICFFSSPTALASMAQFLKRKRTLCLYFFPNIFRSPWNTHENFREYSLRLCVICSLSGHPYWNSRDIFPQPRILETLIYRFFSERAVELWRQSLS